MATHDDGRMFVGQAIEMRVKGVTQLNERGVSRQGRVKRCEPGTPVWFLRDPENPVDRHAVKIMAARSHIGYVPEVLAPEFAAWLDAGNSVEGEVYDVWSFKPENATHRIYVPEIRVWKIEGQSQTARTAARRSGQKSRLAAPLLLLLCGGCGFFVCGGFISGVRPLQPPPVATGDRQIKQPAPVAPASVKPPVAPEQPAGHAAATRKPAEKTPEPPNVDAEELARNEKRARSKLGFAKSLLRSGKRAEAQDYLDEIRNKWPDTEAAKEAAKLGRR